MTGQTEEGAERRFKSVCDEREEARRNVCSGTDEAVHKILDTDQSKGMTRTETRLWEGKHVNVPKLNNPARAV